MAIFFKGKTALKQYSHLESSGLWRQNPTAQRTEVLVVLNETSIVLYHPRKEIPLTHWSLSTVKRLNHTELPAIFAPDHIGSETLELDDGEMIRVLEVIDKAIAQSKAKQGRIRRWFIRSFGIAVLLAAILWLPKAIISKATSILPPTTRQELGYAVLHDIQGINDYICKNAQGLQALEALKKRLFMLPESKIIVLKGGLEQPLVLPGGLILVNFRTITQTNGADALAGIILSEELKAELSDPALPALEYAGLFTTLKLLLTGVLNPTALNGYAQKLLKPQISTVPDELIIKRFSEAGVSSSAYATAVGKSGESLRYLNENDPISNKNVPFLPDNTWVRLQNICS